MIIEFDRVMDWLASMPETVASFGMTHSDHAPGNFHYSASDGITTFDFGNCCYHWYAWDLAVGLRYLRTNPQAKRYGDALLAGYEENSPIETCWLHNLDWFIRLRYLYIYLDRLMELHEDPTDAKRAEVNSWRDALRREINNSRWG